jgi:hypothetical protein
MTFNTRLTILGVITIASIIVAFSLPPQPQSPSYHLFADSTTVLSIPNFYNVVSNLLFVFVGVYGLSLLGRSTAKTNIRVIYAVLFTGIALIAFGSGYYHYSPSNTHLVYDRIPMTIVFMGFLSALITECISEKAGIALLLPLVITGISSVLYWNYTELQQRGDMRFYGLIQFYPMLAIPVIMLLFPSPGKNNQWRYLLWILGWYVIAKLLEHFDAGIYAITGFISGHSLKHIAAAMATWYMVRLFIYKYKPAIIAAS